ncbi:MAG: flagellar hook capping FlgD N-terminal domain-containing protein [Sphingomonadaceae bacterium]
MSSLAIPGLTAPAPQTEDRTGPRMLGQEDFLLLLTTQLKSQDPLSPMDNNAFVAQLAQFATVSGVTEMGVGLRNLAATLAGDTRNAAPLWLGRQVAGLDGVEGIVEQVRLDPAGDHVLLLQDGRQLPMRDARFLA